MRIFLTSILVAGVYGFASGAAEASDSANERASLTGLTTLSVVVEDLSPTAVSSGLTTAALQMDAERRLRQAGIALTPDADAYMYVHVTVADPGPSIPFPYYVDVSLIQEIRLPRGGIQTRTPLQSPTWSVSRLGIAGGDRLRANIVDRVNELVDQFVRAYRSVNPK